MRQRRVSGWLWLILAAYGVLAAAASVIVPLAESPDELDHFLYVRYVVNNGRFPVMDPVAENNETMEANQPPLYYLLGTAVSGWVDMSAPAEMPLNLCYSFDAQDTGRQTFYRHDVAEQFPYRGNSLAFHLVRLLSVLLGAGTVALAYALGRELADRDERDGLLAAGLLAFNPQFIFITGSVNNDVLTALLGAAILWQSVRVAKRPFLSNVLVLALLVGLGLLTKFALIALWPVAVTAVLIPVIGARRPGQEKVESGRSLHAFLINLAVLLILPIVVAGWWYERTRRFYGDVLAWDVHLQAKGAEVLRTTPFAAADLAEFISLHFRSSWGLFGWLNVQAPTWMLGIYAVLVILALVGLVREIWSWRHLAREDGWLVWGQRLLAEKAAFGLTALAVLAVYVSLLRYIQTINWSGYQGRLAFSAAAAVAALLALGLRRLFLKRDWISQVVVGLLAGLAVWAVFGVMADAYPPSIIYDLSPDAAQLCARFENGLMLEGVALPETAVAGEKLAGVLLAYGLADAATPQTVVAAITTGDGSPAAQTELALTWQAGEALKIPLTFPSIETEAPAKGVLQISVLDGGEAQQSVRADGQALEMPFVAGVVKIEPERPFSPQPQVSTNAVFDETVQLIGYDAVEENGILAVTLYWQAVAAPAHDFTTFVHLLDAAGNLVAQADSQPQNGRYPLSLWSPGEIVADTKLIALPAERPLQVMAGLYLLETGERLPLTDNAGDALFLFFLETSE